MPWKLAFTEGGHIVWLLRITFEYCLLIAIQTDGICDFLIKIFQEDPYNLGMGLPSKFEGIFLSLQNWSDQ
jgi:hypothetical protein